MQAVIMAHDQIKAGTNNIMIAGGMENMSQAPYLLPKARAGMRMGHGQVMDSMWHQELTQGPRPRDGPQRWYPEPGLRVRTWSQGLEPRDRT